MNKTKQEMMNTQEKDMLCHLMEFPYENQRKLAEKIGYSLGIVNRSLSHLVQMGLLTKDIEITKKAQGMMRGAETKGAIILAAGIGMRMVPINTEVTKGLLEVRGETLIERLIKQLHQAGITKITIVVGFMKEQYDYLIDEYGVELIVNRNYAKMNNLYSLALLQERLDNSYILPCDIWCEHNPFRHYEMYPWYMITDEESMTSDVRMNRRYELVRRGRNQTGNTMIGVSFLDEEAAEYVRKQIAIMMEDGLHTDAFWEETLWYKDVLITQARCVSGKECFEINTYEQLRALDAKSGNLDSDVIHLAAETFGVEPGDIQDITVLKKGMTNRSFLFRCKGERYIMRIPGEGTEQLINRQEEYDVYNTIRDKKLCDDIYYINPKSGYKITKFLEDARVCNPEDGEDVRRAMTFLRRFHECRLSVDHAFDLFGYIEYYESLWQGEPSAYRDYKQTKEKVYELKEYIEAQKCDRALTHIDAVPDNFMFLKDGGIRLIDWEYAGMQDPHVDIAMFAIYSLYNRDKVEELIDAYFPEGVENSVRLKIYCYIAVCGLLWSNWCEYKSLKGIEFGEYSLRQYRYAKDYYRIFKEERARMKKENENA